MISRAVVPWRVFNYLIPTVSIDEERYGESIGIRGLFTNADAILRFGSECGIED